MPTTRISANVDSAPGVVAWRVAVTVTLAASTVEPVSIDAVVVTVVVASAIIAVICDGGAAAALGLGMRAGPTSWR